MTADLAPFAWTVGGGVLLGFVTGYVIKKVIKLGSGNIWGGGGGVEYQRILTVDWHKVQAVSQNGIDWVADALTHVSSTMGASHPGTLSNIKILLVSSVSAGFF